jgi:hypothetical protein
MSEYIYIEDLTERVMLIHTVEVGANGSPLSGGWRRRLKDAIIDNNCAVIPREQLRRMPLTNRFIKV